MSQKIRLVGYYQLCFEMIRKYVSYKDEPKYKIKVSKNIT